MSIVPIQARGSTSTPATTVDETAPVQGPWDLAHQTTVLAELLTQLTAVVLELRRDVVRDLVEQHRASHSQVARHLGITRTRVGQLVGKSRKQDRSDVVEAVA